MRCHADRVEMSYRPPEQGGRKRLDFKRFSALQGEKGEPGAILTGDVPLEMVKGRKVILSPPLPWLASFGCVINRVS